MTSKGLYRRCRKGSNASHPKLGNEIKLDLSSFCRYWDLDSSGVLMEPNLGKTAA